MQEVAVAEAAVVAVEGEEGDAASRAEAALTVVADAASPVEAPPEAALTGPDPRAPGAFPQEVP